MRLTFAELATAVHRTANALTALGVGRRDPVGVVCPNTGDVLVATSAAQAVGIAAPINPAPAPGRITALLRASGSRVLVVAGPELDAPTWETVAALAPDLGVRALLVVRPTAADPAAPPLPAAAGVLVTYLSDAAAEQPGNRLADAEPPSPTTSPRTSTRAAPPAHRCSPCTPTPTRW